jgi:stage III sporulation protein AG
MNGGFSMSGMTDWFGGKRDNGEGGGPVKFTRKKLIWLAVAVLLGVFLILLGNTGKGGDNGENPQNVGHTPIEPLPVQEKSKMAREEESLAASLEKMLAAVEGCGQVKVTVRLESSAKELYALNKTAGSKNTVEKDQGGGTRTIIENNDATQPVIAKNGNGDTPVVEMEIASGISGVLVVAGGASDPRVRERLFEAVRVSLNVAPHKILVLPGEGGIR